MDGNGTSQPFDGSWIPDTVSHFTFPATLWRLVNNPIVNSIYWDVRGHKVIIDQNLFVEQVLSPSGFFSNDSKPFKTNKFCSFIRQLNLYGFKKANKYEACLTVPACHHFFHPHFKRNHPELVCWLKRLTPKNRAKLQAGVEVKSMPLRRTWPIVKNQADSRETTNRGRASPPLSSHQQSAHPSSLCEVPAPMLTGTPVPPPWLISGVMPPQPVLMVNHSNPHFTGFNHQSSLFESVYYSSVSDFSPPYRCGLPSSMFSVQEHVQTVHLQTHSMDQADSSKDVHNRGSQDARKSSIDPNSFFQITEEGMQTPLTNRLVQVESLHVPELSSNTGGTSSSSDESAPKAVCTVPTEQDDCWTALPEQVPQDVIIDVKLRVVENLKDLNVLMNKALSYV